MPVVLFDEHHDPAGDLAGPLESLVAAGAGVVVLAAATGAEGYDARPELLRRRSGRHCCRISIGSPRSSPNAVWSPCCTRMSGRWSRTSAEVDRVLDGLADPAVPGHRPPADRWHRSAAARPRGARAHQAHAPQGRRRRAGREGAVRRAHLHRGRRGWACTCRWAPVTSTSPASSRRWRTVGSTAGIVMEQDTILDGEPDGEGPAGRCAGQRGLPAEPRRASRREPADRHPRGFADRRERDRRPRSAARAPPGCRRGPRPVARQSVRGQVRGRAGAADLSGCGRRSAGRRRLQPAGELRCTLRGTWPRWPRASLC